ncbi:MAG: hypothetical protein IJ092_07705 [Atopobiaceae bacterium]|nr:hypothetical protein [Atopobiaceae bacterium]
MKRLVTLALSATLVCATPLVLAACGQKGEPEEAATSETAQTDVSDAASTDEVAPFATLGDVFAADGERMSSTFDEQHYVCAFNYDGTWWRVEAALPDGMYDELNEVWVEDQAKVKELLSPLSVAKTDVLEPLDVESIEALAGKTGADLAADGFTFVFGTLVVNGNKTDCVATLGSFDYLVTFDGVVPDENTEDVASAVADMTVSSVSLQSISWDALEG